jgi:tripartite-type tricarboxylate transporter receptor subunit TctC
MSDYLLKGRRHFLAGLAAICSILPVSFGPAMAQDYPDGPIQIIVAYAAGGGTDTLARLLATPLSTELGQPVVVQNVPGGGGQVAAATVLRDGGDGLVILATNQPDMQLATSLNGAQYADGDLQVIMVDVKDPRVMLVRADSDIASFDDFVARAKAEPRKLAVSVAQGSAQELFAKWLFEALDIEVGLVGYQGGGAAANAMLAGDVVATIGDDFARMNIRAEAKALLVGSAEQSPRWSEAPTMTVALAPYGVDLPSPEFLSRYGVYAVPAAFKSDHPEAYAKLQQAMIAARNSQEFQQYLEANRLQDLSLGVPGEDVEAIFAADFAEVGNIGR